MILSASFHDNDSYATSGRRPSVQRACESDFAPLLLNKITALLNFFEHVVSKDKVNKVFNPFAIRIRILRDGRAIAFFSFQPKALRNFSQDLYSRHPSFHIPITFFSSS